MADRADLARDLLALAGDDLAAVHALADAPAVSDAIVGFHAQQATEKALKSVLAATGRDFPFTHNLAVLAQLCEDAGVPLPAELDALDLLTPYGVAARYGVRFVGTVDRVAAQDLATQAVEWAHAIVGP
jgi:HEPN domain-containing protein